MLIKLQKHWRQIKTYRITHDKSWNRGVLKSLKNILLTFTWNSSDLPYHMEGIRKAARASSRNNISVSDTIWKQLITTPMVTETGMKKEIKIETLLDSNATVSSIRVEKKMQLNKQKEKKGIKVKTKNFQRIMQETPNIHYTLLTFNHQHFNSNLIYKNIYIF